MPRDIVTPALLVPVGGHYGVCPPRGNRTKKFQVVTTPSGAGENSCCSKQQRLLSGLAASLCVAEAV